MLQPAHRSRTRSQRLRPRQLPAVFTKAHRARDSQAHARWNIPEVGSFRSRLYRTRLLTGDLDLSTTLRRNACSRKRNSMPARMLSALGVLSLPVILSCPHANMRSQAPSSPKTTGTFSTVSSATPATACHARSLSTKASCVKST